MCMRMDLGEQKNMREKQVSFQLGTKLPVIQGESCSNNQKL